MDLPDGRSGERLGLERAKDHIRFRAELLSDDLADVGVRERLDLVEQLEQLVAVGRREQVIAQRQHLPELDP